MPSSIHHIPWWEHHFDGGSKKRAWCSLCVGLRPVALCSGSLTHPAAARPFRQWPTGKGLGQSLQLHLSVMQKVSPGHPVSQGTQTSTRRLRLSAILESDPGKSRITQPCQPPVINDNKECRPERQGEHY